MAAGQENQKLHMPAGPGRTRPGVIALGIEHLTKRYPGVTALDDVSIQIEAGSAHGIVGENGAGKSTLVDIVAGMQHPTSGTVQLFGTDVTAWPARRRLRRGVAVVSQGLRLAPHLDVAHNLLTLGGGDGARPGRKALFTQAEQVLGSYGIALDVRARPDDLRPDEQQLVAIVRALEADPRLLLLDEPTSNLTGDQVRWLFGLLRKRREEGLTVVFVSHRLPEVRALTSRVTVLRDGQVSGEVEMAGSSDRELVRLMVGQELTAFFPDRSDTEGQARERTLELAALSADHPVEPISGLDLTIRRGEIVGIAGVQGNGQQTVLRAIAGLIPFRGTLRVAGTALKPGSVRQAQRAGIRYVPRDRRREGLLSTLSIRENLALGNMAAVARRGVILPGRERALARAAIERLSIRAPSISQPAGLLSGGNQQKVVLGRTLAGRAQVLLLDDPTQGVDIGTKSEIYQLIADTAAQGVAVLLFSTDAVELAALCDRALVFSRGRVVAELGRHELSEENLVAAAVTAGDRPPEQQPPDLPHARTTGSHAARDGTLGEPGRGADARSGAQVFPGWSRRRPRGPSVLPVLGLLIALAIITQAVNPSFLGAANLYTLLQSIAPLLVVSLGQTAVLLVGGIDLSVGPLMSVVTVIASYWITGSPGSYWWAVLVILLIGAATGMANGVIIEFGAVPDLIATLGTYTILEGVALVIRAQPGGTVARTFVNGLSKGVAFLPDTFIIAAIAALVFWWFLFRRKQGVGLRAAGSSRAAARVAGLPVRRLRLATYVASGLAAAIAGLFLTSIIGSGDPSSGTTYTLSSITAAVVGGVSVFGGQGSPVGTLIGALLVGSLDNLLSLQGFSQYWQSVLVGVLTALAVASYSVSWKDFLPGGFRRPGRQGTSVLRKA
jgi:ribose transport system ATP-binding protein